VSENDLDYAPFVGTFFMTDALVLPGNSGGGAWNGIGELVGIVSMTTNWMASFGGPGYGIVADEETIRNFLYN